MINKLLLRGISTNTLNNLEELGYSQKSIKDFSKRRLQVIALLVFIFCPLFYIKTNNIVLVFLTLILAMLFWFVMDRKPKLEVKKLRRNKHFEFLNFAKLIVPYLKSDIGSKSLYTVLNKMANRTDDPVFKSNIKILMIDMTEAPDSIEPLTNFAKTVSNTDLAEDFMIALYDWQQTSDDTAVIARMERKITEAMIERIDEIIEIKKDRFDHYVTRIFYSIFFLMMGIQGIVFYAQLAPLLEML